MSWSFQTFDCSKKKHVPTLIFLTMLWTVWNALLLNQVLCTHSYRTLPYSSILMTTLLLPDPLPRVIGWHKKSSIWITTATLSVHLVLSGPNRPLRLLRHLQYIDFFERWASSFYGALEELVINIIKSLKIQHVIYVFKEMPMQLAVDNTYY